jgi:hypothetical protein
VGEINPHYLLAELNKLLRPDDIICNDQPCDGGILLLAMYFATVVCPTPMPTFSSLPCTAVHPKAGLRRSSRE